jgi:hypothetical protein
MTPRFHPTGLREMYSTRATSALGIVSSAPSLRSGDVPGLSLSRVHASKARVVETRSA